MMKQPVEQRCGKNLVPQQAAPLAETRIGGKPDGAVLIASRDQLKEMVGLSRRELGVSHLVNHEHTGGRVATKPLANQARIRGRIQCLSQLRQRGKQGRIPRGEGFDRKRQAEVCFSPSIEMPPWTSLMSAVFSKRERSVNYLRSCSCSS